MVGLLERSNQPKRFQVCFPGSKQLSKGTKWQAEIWEVSKIEGEEVYFVCHRDFESTCTDNCVSAWLWQDHIHKIRQNYTRDFKSKDITKKQIAVATYLIDKLALRAGNEKVLSYWMYSLQWFCMMGHSCTQDIFLSAYISSTSCPSPSVFCFELCWHILHATSILVRMTMRLILLVAVRWRSIMLLVCLRISFRSWSLLFILNGYSLWYILLMLSDVWWPLQFDFLGKDSIRYFNTVEVELPVYNAIEEFRAGISHDLSQLIHFFMS
jgi:hypothetical protein